MSLDPKSYPEGFWRCFTADLLARSQKRPKISTLFKHFLFKSSYKTVVYYRIAMYFKRKRFGRLLFGLIARILLARLSRVPGVDFNTIYEIGPGLKLKHPHDIVLGYGSRIGQCVTIYNGVTLGAKHRFTEDDLAPDKPDRYPKIGDGVIIFSGAKILGDVTIGAHSVVGANAVVIDSFPENSIIAGIPARIISQRQ
jgi:serine O-acetyltransferase